MNDNDIIKALEHCLVSGDCAVCMYNEARCLDLTQDAFDLINRQKAEIDRLIDLTFELTEDNEAWVADNHDLRIELKTAKAEAIKEFAQRIEPKLANNTDISAVGYQAMIAIIDSLVKEMIGDQK